MSQSKEITQSQLLDAIIMHLKAKLPALIVGPPGVGKTDIVHAAAKASEYDVITMYPALSDPTDAKGFPIYNNETKEANFVPFGELKRVYNADRPTVVFLDDLGQSAPSVQASFMNLLSARRINGYKVPDDVVFLAATNRRGDRAGVSGIIEPVKSRFSAIYNVKVDPIEWLNWANNNDFAPEILAFVKLRPGLLHNFVPSVDIVNTACPRTVHSLNKLFITKVPKSIESQVYTGAVGEAFADEFMSFLQLYRSLPDVAKMIEDPECDIPEEMDRQYAIAAALSYHVNSTNIANVIKLLNRFPKELEMMTVSIASRLKKDIMHTEAFVNWSVDNQDLLIR